MPTCERCGGPNTSTAQPCPECREETTQEAQDWREVDYLVNYLSTRVDRAGRPRDGVEPSRPEAAQLARLVVRAKALGVDWTKPRPVRTWEQRLAALRAVEPAMREGRLPYHTLSCRRCGVTYRETYGHCCVCGRVFSSMSAFERHQVTPEPADDAKLLSIGLVKREEDGVWANPPMDDKSRAQLEALNRARAARKGKLAP